MPKAYVIVDMDVRDPDQYAQYVALATPATAAAGGRYLVRGGTAVVLEGDRNPKRTAILEFPDLESAQAWYDSPEYTAARELRKDVATGSLIAVEGV